MPRSVHGTTTANTIATVTLDADFGSVEILNRDGAGELFITVDGPDPTVGGNDTEVLPAAIGTIVLSSLHGGATVVKLISSAVVKYSVRGV